MKDRRFPRIVPPKNHRKRPKRNLAAIGKAFEVFQPYARYGHGSMLAKFSQLARAQVDPSIRNTSISAHDFNLNSLRRLAKVIIQRRQRQSATMGEVQIGCVVAGQAMSAAKRHLIRFVLIDI
ncbi:MAG: hypothetical protein AABZ47_13260 [Planctomycetota bacterium]